MTKNYKLNLLNKKKMQFFTKKTNYKFKKKLNRLLIILKRIAMSWEIRFHLFGKIKLEKAEIHRREWFKKEEVSGIQK